MKDQSISEKIPDKLHPQDYEQKWQKKWEEVGTYSPDLRKAPKPFYNLMMFPYPSAEGLHVGNMYAFTGVDVYGRFKRMQGYDVFEPIGLDGFGIHSENYALKVNKHPKEQAKVSQANFYRQLRAIGNGFDFRHTLVTYDPEYYRWTQWLFVQMFKHGLAYRAKASVNWCPSCKTVLADEQVINEKCERCSSIVEKKELEQWFFRITAYAEKLLHNTYKPSFKWSEKVKIGQQHWIGKKTGIIISYQTSAVSGQTFTLECFTTTPVNWAATFIVIAPEHPLTQKLTTKDRLSDVKLYIDAVKKMSQSDRIAQGKEKTGVFTGSYAINHVTGEKMPIWVSDFVLMGVGTGAVQGCPGHDLRDFEFATKFNIPIKRVVVGPDGDISPIKRSEQVIESGSPGKMINSEFLNGMNFKDAMEKTKDYFVEKGWGKRVTTYHLRDWLISRQRYWGAPIPMIYCEECAKAGESWFTSKSGQQEMKNLEFRIKNSKLIGNSMQSMAGWYPVPDEQLPVLLPDVENWRPTGTGRGPLAGVPEFYETTCPHCKGKAVRETDVCDTFLDSSWYFLRYPSVTCHPEQSEGSLADASSNKLRDSSPALRDQNDKKLILPWNTDITKRWLPVHSYIGGAEHTVLHLLYARFMWMTLRDWGYLALENETETETYNPNEPFRRFFAHGLIIKDGAKMSKSKGNVVIPDQYIKLYGADTLRTYLMFLGPFAGGGDFRDSGIAGMYKWLSRVWRLVNSFANQGAHNPQKSSQDSLKLIHKTIKAVTQDIEELNYNTAIAKLMECVNWWMDHEREVDESFVLAFLKLIAPFAPHMTEELFQKLEVGNGSLKSIHLQSWPSYDESLVIEDQVVVIVQINGKTRETFTLSHVEAQDQSMVEQKAKASAKIDTYLSDKLIRKVIFVPGKLINFVI